MKNLRLARILEIIEENYIETQDELMAKLREDGFTVTQATVSRDINQLGLVKAAGKNGVYHYAPPKSETLSSGSKLKNMMRETILSAKSASNIIVVKTYAGMANAAAAAIDSLCGESIIGSIAGDDTIFIVVADSKEAIGVTSFIKGIIGA